MAMLKSLVDERFWTHRLRSTSIAGIVSALVALGVFYYRYFHDRVLNWDLLGVAVLFAVVKMGLMTYYTLTD